MKNKLLQIRNNRVLNYLSPIILLAFMFVFFTALSGGKFARLPNLNIILNQALIVGIVATGGVLIYASGNMNMAMGGSTAIACIVGAKAYLLTGSPILMLLVCVLTGILIMGLCSVLSEIFKIGVIVITLIMMTMLSSLQEWIIGSNQIQLDYGAMKLLQDSNIALIIFVLYFVICIFLFNFMKLGKITRFIGENSNCARQTGINEKKAVAIAFVIAGIGIGFGAFASLIRTTSVATTTCSTLNMDVILAIVLAGTPMTGGSKSKIFSGIVGALMVTTLNNGLLMVGVNSIYIQAVRGVLFIVILMMSERRPDVLPVKDMI